MYLWDILICALVERREMCRRLVAKLKGQIEAAGLAGQVGVLTLEDAGKMSIGEKRNSLVAQSEAEYVCFVDDDDDVSDDYVSAIYDAIKDRQIDVVGITGTVNHPLGSKRWMPFYHSLRYTTYHEDAVGIYRPPTHLNPMRRSVVQRHEFANLYGGEDWDFAMRVLASGDLKIETFIDRTLYIYVPGLSWIGKKAKPVARTRIRNTRCAC